MERFFVGILLVCFVGLCLGGPHGQANGFNDQIDWWNNLDDAMKEIKETKKPGIVLIHKSWCGACKNLKRQVDSPAGAAIVAASSKFVMVNLSDEDEPSHPDFRADGGYIPRLFFVDVNGKVRTELKNPGGRGDKYAYFYYDAKLIVDAMEKYYPQLIEE
mmetsp:Transcript_35900/g.49173  ORF Transcript_35900/g.49173 Transcript_35900/m.49173 type:complete len:160 (+) Transcript_35900:190-669(+)